MKSPANGSKRTNIFHLFCRGTQMTYVMPVLKLILNLVTETIQGK